MASKIIKFNYDNDAALKSYYYPNTNYVSDDIMACGGWGDYYVPVFQIDKNMFDGIDGEITKVELVVTGFHEQYYSNQTQTVKMYKFNGSWNPTTITWNNKPSWTYVKDVFSTTNSFTGSKRIDITNEYKSWKTNNAFYGLAFYPSSASNGTYFRFYSYNYSDASKRPYLEVTYEANQNPINVFVDSKKTKAKKVLVKVENEWKTAKKIFVKTGGAWKQSSSSNDNSSVKQKTYLYKAGDQCSSITGGWSTTLSLPSWYWPTVKPATFNSDHIQFYASGSRVTSGSATKNKISLKNYKKLYVDAKPVRMTASYAHMSFSLYNYTSEQDGWSAASISFNIDNTRKVYELDLSNYNDSYFIGGLTTSDHSGTTELIVYNVWLEA